MGVSRVSFGALGHVLGLSGASRFTEEGFQIHVGTLLGLACSLLAAKDGARTEAYGHPQPLRGLGRQIVHGLL